MGRRVGKRIHRCRPARPALELVQTGVGGDPVQPCLKLRAGLVALERSPCPQEGLLDDVLGIVRGTKHPIAVDLERVAVWLRQPAERSLIARLRRRQ